MMTNLVRVVVIAGALAVGTLVAPAAQAYGPTAPPGPVENLKVLDGWGAASVSWWSPNTGGGWETAYHIRVLDPAGNVVATATNGGFDTHVSIGPLTNGTTYTFEVTAENDLGTGPPVTGQGTPYVPSSYVEMYAYARCPGWAVVNGANPFPIWFTWESGKQSGGAVVREKDEVAIGGDGSKVAIYVDGQLHDRTDDSNCPRVKDK